MIHNREICISTAGSRRATSWPTCRMTWQDFVEKLRTPLRGAEAYAAYIRMPKAQQDALKDVGGFVGGALRNGRRKNADVLGRDIVTLDLDAIRSGHTANVIKNVAALGVASCIYSTRKHCPDKPRLRVVLPIDRTVTAEEYEPIARRIGEQLGIEQCDPTTFEAVRMMYWPSCCADGEYVYKIVDAPLVSADAILATYHDWHNMRSWPQLPGAQTELRASAEKAENPTEKTGVVGAFCRKYDVYRVMSELIPDAYTPTDEPGRFTYAHGSTIGGAIVYGDGLWLYSHHGTDPAGGRLVNAWDLARLHLYGDRDEATEPGTPTHRLPSYAAMRDRALADVDIRVEITKARTKSADDDFGEQDWMRALSLNDMGVVRATIDNILLILRHDPRVTERIAYDQFAQQIAVTGDLPWRTDEGVREWTDSDDNGLAWWLEDTYGIAHDTKRLRATDLIAQERRYDALRDYLDGLVWDGIPRVDTLLIRYLCADDTPYTRAVTRKALTAAVARGMEPGAKFDNVLTLIGAQGCGKSLFTSILGGDWYTDNIQTFTDKESAEPLRKRWIVELSEVDRFSARDAAQCKQYITRQDDVYREAYGRRTISHPRRCVFIATTNTDTFLTDDSGNRRWWPVTCHATARERGADLEELRDERDQVWAEAVALWRVGEPLTLDGDVASEAVERQEAARIEEPWAGIIREFVDRRVPADWDQRTVQQRTTWWANDFGREAVETFERAHVCAQEVWVEALGGDERGYDGRAARRINSVLKGLSGWRAERYHDPCYGRQRGLFRQI